MKPSINYMQPIHKSIGEIFYVAVSWSAQDLLLINYICQGEKKLSKNTFVICRKKRSSEDTVGAKKNSPLS